MTKVDAVTFDDFNTLRYEVGEQEDIIYPILGAMEIKIEIKCARLDMLKTLVSQISAFLVYSLQVSTVEFPPSTLSTK